MADKKIFTTDDFRIPIRIMPDILSTEVSGETVLLNLKNERYYGLNEVGTRIWQLLKDDGDLQKIYETLLDEYEIGESKLRQDISDIVNELLEAELIEIG